MGIDEMNGNQRGQTAGMRRCSSEGVPSLGSESSIFIKLGNVCRVNVVLVRSDCFKAWFDVSTSQVQHVGHVDA